MEYAPVVDQRPASMPHTYNSRMVPGGCRSPITFQHFRTHSWPMQNAPGFVRQDAMMPLIPGRGIVPVVDQRPASMHPTNNSPMVMYMYHRFDRTPSWMQNAPGVVRQNPMMPSVLPLEKGKCSPATEDGSLQWKAKNKENAVKLVKLRKKIEKVTRLRTEIHQEDNSAALDKTILLNQQESDEAREGCQQKVSELPREVSDGNGNLASKSEEAKMNLAEMQRKTDQDLNQFKSENASIRETHKKDLEALEKEKLKEEHLKETVVSDGNGNLASKPEEVKMNLAEMQTKTEQELKKVKPGSASIRETYKKDLEALEKEKLKEEHLKETVNEACPVTPKQYQKCHLMRAATVPSMDLKSIFLLLQDLLSNVIMLGLVIQLSCLLASSSASNTVECLPVQYAPLMGRAVVRCDGLGVFPRIYWFNDIADDATAFIQKENGEVTGSGYRAGDYNIDNEGSLVINNVTLRDDRTFQVGVLDSDLIESSYDITLIVYVEPAEPLPVIPECSGQSTCILKGESNRFISCIHGQSRPAMEMSWFLRVGREDRLLNATVSQMVSADAVTFTTSAQLAIKEIPVDANMNQLLVLVCKSVQAIPGMKDTERKILLDISVDDPFTNAENLDPVHAFERQEDFKIKCQSEIDTANNVVLWMYKSLIGEDFENILYSTYGEVAFTTKGEAGFNITDNGALVIKEVDRQHEGYYACVSSLAITFVKNLEVIVLPNPPRILVHGCEPFQPCHLSAREVEDVTCTVNGVRPQVDLSIVTYSTNVAVTKTTASSYKEDGLFYTTIEGHVDISKVTCEENHVTVICQARGTAAYGFMSDAYIIVPVDGDDCAETSTDMIDPDDDGSGNTLFVKVGITLVVLVVVLAVITVLSVCRTLSLEVARRQCSPHHEMNSQKEDVEVLKFSNGESGSYHLPITEGSKGESELEQHQPVAGQIEDRSGS